jgi:hypothetical protein
MSGLEWEGSAVSGRTIEIDGEKVAVSMRVAGHIDRLRADNDALREAFEVALMKLKVCAAAHGNSPESIDIMIADLRSAAMDDPA